MKTVGIGKVKNERKKKVKCGLDIMSDWRKYTKVTLVKVE